jgi:hypothetical protein
MAPVTSLAAHHLLAASSISFLIVLQVVTFVQCTTKLNRNFTYQAVRNVVMPTHLTSSNVTNYVQQHTTQGDAHVYNIWITSKALQ